MNVVGYGTLDDVATATLVADVAALCRDTDTGTSLTWIATGTRAYQPGSGTVDYAETRTTVTAWVSDLSLEQVQRIEGAQLGDVSVLIAFADLATAPATDDRFLVGTGTSQRRYAVYRAISGPLSTHVHCFAHRTD